MTVKQAIFAVRCASQKKNHLSDEMFFSLPTICGLAAEIHGDADHDASITASAMLQCGELRRPHFNE